MSIVTFDWDQVTTPIHDNTLLSYNQTDTGNAEAFLYLFGKDLRFIKERKQWVRFDGIRWKPADELVHNRMVQTVRSIRVSAQDHYVAEEQAATLRRIEKWTFDSESQFRIQAALRCAENFLAESINDFDREKWLFACKNHVVDLRTGFPVASIPDLFLMRCNDIPWEGIDADHSDEPECNRWLQFLDEVFAGDQDLIRFVQKAVGYTLTGDTCEQCFFLLHGLGANGKSVFLAVLERLMGEYGITTGSSTFMEQKNDGIPNDVARMAGARFVKAIEVKEMSQFNIEKMKSLTGGDKISARFLHAEFFDFHPMAKFWLAVNHKPNVNDPTYSFWRRTHEIPFDVTFGPDKQDRHLLDKLIEELPGIFQWALDGCLLWQKEGLERPEAVKRATEEYQSESDSVGAFFTERLEPNLIARVRASLLYRAYCAWCSENGFVPVSPNIMGVSLKVRGYPSVKIGRNKISVYKGLRLLGKEEVDDIEV